MFKVPGRGPQTVREQSGRIRQLYLESGRGGVKRGEWLNLSILVELLQLMK